VFYFQLSLHIESASRSWDIHERKSPTTELSIAVRTSTNDGSQTIGQKFGVQSGSTPRNIASRSSSESALSATQYVNKPNDGSA